jgi:hypothetical protein
MAVAKHTPGRWEVVRTEKGHEIRMGTALDRACVYQTQHIVPYDHGLFLNYDDGERVGPARAAQFEEAEANANLMAAAPDVYLALVGAAGALASAREVLKESVYPLTLEVVSAALADAQKAIAAAQGAPNK